MPAPVPTRCAALALAGLWLPAAASVQGEGPARGAPDALAFVELAGAHESAWLGEPVELALRFGVAAHLEREGLLQLFQARLDVPVHVSIAELVGLDGAEVEVPVRDDPLDASFALDDAVTRARRIDDRTRDGTRFSTWQIELRILPTSPGRLALPAPSLRFAWATRFEERFAEGRVALDRREGLVTGEPLALDVRPLPDEGRPPGFTGAVGRFRLDATVDPREVRVGESVKLELTITGAGNHGHFDAPDLEPLAGFHVRGRLVERGPQSLVAIYDLAPRDTDVDRVPALSFACFAPGPEPGYAVLTTPSFPIRVLPARPAPTPGLATQPAPVDAAPARRGGDAALFALLALGALALVVALVARARRARRARRNGTIPR